jgi:hypothetical protein
MEPITIAEYTSDRAFHFSEVAWGQHMFALHGFGGKFLGDAIDLIFLNTDYVNLPFELRGLRISQPCDESAIRFEKEFGFVRKFEEQVGKRVFVVESQGQYQVIAAKMWVVVRTHKPGMSVKPLLGENEGERSKFIDEHVKEWYRMCALYDSL